MKRRGFFKKSALTLGTVVVGIKEVLAQEHKEHPMPGTVQEPKGMEMKHEKMKMHEPIPWADPSINLSPPPPLMGNWRHPKQGEVKND